MTKCYTLKKTKGNPRCEQVEGCVWDKKKRCQPRTRKNTNSPSKQNPKNISMKLDKIMEELSMIRKEIGELRKTSKNTSPSFSPSPVINTENEEAVMFFNNNNKEEVEEEEEDYDDGSMEYVESEPNVNYNSPNELSDIKKELFKNKNNTISTNNMEKMRQNLNVNNNNTVTSTNFQQFKNNMKNSKNNNTINSANMRNIVQRAQE